MLLVLLVPMSPAIVNIGGVTELGLYMLLPFGCASTVKNLPEVWFQRLSIGLSN